MSPPLSRCYCGGGSLSPDINIILCVFRRDFFPFLLLDDLCTCSAPEVYLPFVVDFVASALLGMIAGGKIGIMDGS